MTGLFLPANSNEIAFLQDWSRRSGNPPTAEGIKKTILQAARAPARGNVAALAGAAVKFCKDNPDMVRSAATVARAMLKA